MINNTRIIHNTWDDLYKYSNASELPWVSESIHPILKEAIDKILRKRNSRALDIGCGLGQTSRYLNKIGYRTTAIDIAAEAIKKAKQISSKEIDFRVSNSVYFSDDKKYDLIVDFLHIHDIIDKKIGIYLNNVEKILSSNGTYIIATFVSRNTTNNTLYTRDSLFVDQRITYYTKQFILNQFEGNFKIVSHKLFSVGKCYPSYIIVIKKA